MSDQHVIPPPHESPGPGTEIDKTSVINVNFNEGKIVSKIQSESDQGIPKFLREMAKLSKKNNVKSVIVLTIDGENHVDWAHIADSEHHLALAALCLDDIKDDLKNRIFSEEEA